jgi:glycosyltransferase involved in cell wall biosynthesis
MEEALIPEIDVLVCAYNEAATLPALFDSLRAQTVGVNSFRVIFVDNASHDDTPQTVQDHAAGLNLLYVHEPRIGLNSARNAGYARSRTPYVAHIDADNKAHPQWLEGILRIIDEEKPDLCGGPYLPYYITPKPAWFEDAYNSCWLGDTPHYLSAGEYLSGPNMTWRRNLVEALGGFSVDIGLKKRGLTRGDETELILRARREVPGFKAFYHPRVIVYHATRAETLSMKYWVRRSFVEGRHSRMVRGSTSTVSPAGRLRLVAGALKLSAQLAVEFGKAALWRDRARHAYFENHIWDRALPLLTRLGDTYERLFEGTLRGA